MEMVSLLCTYLTDQMQCVRVNYSLSDVMTVLSGVPQGINDLPMLIKFLN